MTDGPTHDLVVLGGGAAAFAALTEAHRRGLSTALVNAGLPLGGTCVNVGCIPSKHLLAVGEAAAEPATNPFDAVTYGAGEPGVDWAAALDGTDRLVGRMRRENYVDVAAAFDVDVLVGRGTFVDETTIEVGSGPDAGTRVSGAKAVVATGSSPRTPPIDGLDEVTYVTSESILERRELPASMVILGGGFVALEWGQILHRVGVDVTLLQRSDHVLSDMEPLLGRTVGDCLREEGVEILTGTAFDRVERDPDTGEVAVSVRVDGDGRTVAGEDLFVATGVRPNTADAGLEEVGVDLDEHGAVVVDEELGTTASNVYAAGDVVGEPMLETVAAKEGNVAVRNAFGDEGVSVDYDAVPAVVFTTPEVATVGVTEAEYMAEHGTCACRTVEVADLPKAQAVGDTRGVVQVVKHHETDAIVGVHVVSPRAGDIVPAATLAVKHGLTVDDVIDTVHPFPTFSEGLKRACQAFRRDTSTMSCCVE